MHYRSLGATGVLVSEVGLGCNRLGEAARTDRHRGDLVRKAVELGVMLFDTPESYGWGRSEEILGQALRPADRVVIATKVSRIQATNEKDFSAARIIQQVEGSLRWRRRDWVDLYQLHSPSLVDLQRFDWQEAMLRLREQGKIRLIGVSINDAPAGNG